MSRPSSPGRSSSYGDARRLLDRHSGLSARETGRREDTNPGNTQRVHVVDLTSPSPPSRSLSQDVSTAGVANSHGNQNIINPTGDDQADEADPFRAHRPILGEEIQSACAIHACQIQTMIRLRKDLYHRLDDRARGSASALSRPQRSASTPHNVQEASSTAARRQARQVGDENRCWVCHRELPSLGPNGDSTARDAHVLNCVNTASSSTRSTMGRVRYLATEKDCLTEDGGVAECQICMEDFEAGVAMARLECLCRFHERCIVEWWEKKPGSCPTHHLQPSEGAVAM
ncbi:hypothetical protein LTR28_009972 [Elasticomyces elasticus]|nr:hypothetical protein LTR28_009972 [Elasticomyces elasticus]